MDAVHLIRYKLKHMTHNYVITVNDSRIFMSIGIFIEAIKQNIKF